MDQAREFFGLFLILVFTAMLPGFVNTCPSCLGVRLPSLVMTTTVSVFSGTVDSVDETIVSVDGKDAVLRHYGVTATSTWVGIGDQLAQLALPSVDSQVSCSSIIGEADRSALFLVIGRRGANPYFWACVPPLF